MTTGRSQMLSTGDIRDLDAVVDQVLRCLVLKAPVDRPRQLASAIRHCVCLILYDTLLCFADRHDDASDAAVVDDTDV